MKQMHHEKLAAVWQIIRTAATIILILFSLFLIGYYTLFPSRGFFHSDTSDTLIWAEASVESHSLFNPDFSYACLLPFGTSLIMTALIPFTGVTMTTHVIGMLIFFLLFAGSLILMLRNMGVGWGWTSITLFLTLMLCSGSEKLREIFWGHTIYYSLGVFFIFTGLSLVFRYLHVTERPPENHNQKKKRLLRIILLTLLILIWFILTCSDQIIAITIFALPVIGAVFCERWFDQHSKILSWKNFHSLVLILVMIIGMIGGYLLTNILANGIRAAYEEAYSAYSDMATWADHAQLFPTAWLSLLGANMQDNEPLMSLKSIKNLLIVITGILLLLLPVIALFCWNQIQDANYKILLLTYWFMTILIMMGYIMGKLSVANWRLSPIVSMSAVVSILFLRWACSQLSWKRMGILLLLPVMIVSICNSGIILSMKKDNTQDNYLYALSDELKAHGLNYGYATFWRANGLTIVSDSAIKCRSVDITDTKGCYIRYYQCNKNWYEDQENQQQYFLLMTPSESKDLENAGSPLLTKPHIRMLIKGYEVWIFNENIF